MAPLDEHILDTLLYSTGVYSPDLGALGPDFGFEPSLGLKDMVPRWTCKDYAHLPPNPVEKQIQKESPHETCALKWQDIRQSLIPEVGQELDKMCRRSQVALKQKETQMETNEYLKLQAEIIAEHRRAWGEWRTDMGLLLAGALDRIAAVSVAAGILYVIYSIGMYTSETERMKVTREIPTATFVLPKEG